MVHSSRDTVHHIRDDKEAGLAPACSSKLLVHISTDQESLKQEWSPGGFVLLPLLNLGSQATFMMGVIHHPL